MGEDVPVSERTDTEREAPVANPASDAALARYARRMRPLRIAYAAVLAVAVIVIAAIVVVAYRRGEISHVTLRTVPSGPAPLTPQATSATLTKAWVSSDTTAIGTPYYRGTVVTHDRHTVRGRDARTGQQTWSYTRTDRTVCTAIQDDAVTIAVYELHGNCDELTALDSSTGRRKWTRTLDKDRAEFNGPATYWVQPDNVMFVSSTSIYSISTAGDEDQGNGQAGLDHWTFHHDGCTINGAVLGAAGALISQTCVHQDCSGAKFCGDGRQLLLRNGLTGNDSDSKTNKNNPDQIIWNKLDNNLVPTLAGQQVGAREPAGGALQLLNANNGDLGARLALTGRSDTAAPSAVSSARDADLVWIGGRTYELPAGSTAFGWQADTRSVPIVSDVTGDAATELSGTEVAVPTASGLALLDSTTGKVTTNFAVEAPPDGSLVYPLGSGFLVAGPSTTVYR
jgi:hypothetical protein